jgi:hypothetical protein
MTTMTTTVRLLACVAIAASSAACVGYERQSTVGPSAGGLQALMGNWASTSAIPAPSSCADFKWNVSEQTSSAAKGSFSATCAGDLKVAGTAEGTLANGTVAWSARAVATGPGGTACDISLTGTAELGMDSVRVPYTGTTCLGPVSGTEVLRRR